MSAFSWISTNVELHESSISRFADLQFDEDAGVLFASSHYDGGITSWLVSQSSVSVADYTEFQGTIVAGADPKLLIFDDMILSGGGISDRLDLLNVTASGAIIGRTDLGPNSVFLAPLIDPSQISLINGDRLIFAGILGHTGIASLRLNTANQIISSEIAHRDLIQDEVGVVATVAIAISGNNFLFTANANNTMSAWSVDQSGELALISEVGASDAAWFSGLTALELVSVESKDFLVAAGSQSSSLTAMEIAADGSLTVVDHIIDGRQFRFSGANELATLSNSETGFIIASGSDDGISAFSIGANGRFVHRATVADQATTSLLDVNGLAVTTTSTGVDVFAVSSKEQGLTRMRLDIGGIGEALYASNFGGQTIGTSFADVIYGSNKADVIDGGSGDDVIFDGSGQDTLTGGEGADVFVFSFDGHQDTILDFELGKDEIDLSDWPMLGSLAQLQWASTQNGIEIVYGSDSLAIKTLDGSTLALGQFSVSDLLGPDRLPALQQSGFQNPNLEIPVLPDRVVYEIPQQPVPPEEGGALVAGTNDSETLVGTDYGDSIFGASNNDVLYGFLGSDILNGGSGIDRLYGGFGSDTLFGGTGRDYNWDRSDQVNLTGDTLFGEEGDDVLFGQSGDDRLVGGLGNDLLRGGSGRDTFVFEHGHDQILDFTPFVDRIEIDSQLLPDAFDASDLLREFGNPGGSYFELDFNSGNILQIYGLDDHSQLDQWFDIA